MPTLNAESVLQHLCDRREAVGGAGSVRNHVVLRRVVGLVVHAEDDGVIGIGGGRGNDHFLHRAADVLARVGAFGEQAGGFDDDRRADGGPVELRRILDLENLEALAVDGDRVVRVGDLVRQIAEDRIVFQQMRQGLRIRDVVDGDNLDRRIAQRGAKNIAADAAKPVDPHFYGHAASEEQLWLCGPCAMSAAVQASQTNG